MQSASRAAFPSALCGCTINSGAPPHCGAFRDDQRSANDLAQELADPLVLGVGEEMLRRTLLDDLTVGHEDHPVGHLAGEAHLVGDDHHRDVLFVGQIDHDIQHFLNGLRVQRTGRLIEQDDLGLCAQRPRNGDALLLAAGKLGRVDVRLIPQAHDFQIVYASSSASCFDL